MRRMRIFLAGAVMACFLTISLNDTGWASKDKPLVGITMRTYDNAFLVTLKDGIQKKIEAAGGEVLVHDCRSDVGRQIEAIEEFTARGVDVIFIQAFDRIAVIPAVMAANKAGIAVITVDSTLSDVEIAASVTSDNVMAGRLCGEYLAERLRKEKGAAKGNVVILEGKASVTVLNRLQGFREAIQAHPDIKIIATGNSTGKMDIAIVEMEKILKSHAHIDGVFAINDPTADGALTSIESVKREKEMFIVSVDGSKKALEAIKRGSAWSFTAAQSPFAIGETAVDIALKILKGEKPAKTDVLVPVSPVSPENVDPYLKNAKF